jgi:hypothetical protein
MIRVVSVRADIRLENVARRWPCAAPLETQDAKGAPHKWDKAFDDVSATGADTSADWVHTLVVQSSAWRPSARSATTG